MCVCIYNLYLFVVPLINLKFPGTCVVGIYQNCSGNLISSCKFINTLYFFVYYFINYLLLSNYIMLGCKYKTQMVTYFELFVGFDTTLIFGWTFAIARSNISIFQWHCFQYNRTRTWFTNRWAFLWDFTTAYCCSIPGAGLCLHVLLIFTHFIYAVILHFMVVFKFLKVSFSLMLGLPS